MRIMTVEEIKAMVGTEFVYVFEDGDGIPAVVAAFDPKKGLTCLATTSETTSGIDFSNLADANGNICIASFERGVYENDESFLDMVSRELRIVKLMGYMSSTKAKIGRVVDPTSDWGDPLCAL
jgi:hypothetical protein